MYVQKAQTSMYEKLAQVFFFEKMIKKLPYKFPEQCSIVGNECVLRGCCDGVFNSLLGVLQNQDHHQPYSTGC
jgi:hypothetical protein